MTNAAQFSRSIALVAVLVLGSLAAAGCTSEGRVDVAPTTLVEGVEAPVQAIDNSFRPETTTVAAGTEVVWANRGRTGHNVLPTDDGEGWGVEEDGFAPGDEYRYRFTEPGEYPYYCSLHGTKDAGMVGTIVVTDGPVEDGDEAAG